MNDFLQKVDTNLTILLLLMYTGSTIGTSSALVATSTVQLHHFSQSVTAHCQ